MDTTDDVLIVGRGIAGAVLAETLRQRGARVHVFDAPRAGSASRVAAGVVNPVVLRRDVLSWRAAELLPLAGSFYSRFGQRYGEVVWHPTELVKLFPGHHEEDQWMRAMRDPATAPFIDRRPQPEVDNAGLAPHGHGTVVRCAWLDVARMLDLQREALLRDGALTEEEVGEAEVLEKGIRINGRTASWVVHCTGAFSVVAGLVPVQGEGLTVRIPGLRLTRIVHRGVFLLPSPALGADVYRVGATFKWEDVWAGTTEEGRRWLVERMQRLVDGPVEVLDQWSGVRPASKDRRPILGITGPHQAVFNGLGSRGVMLAPWCAEHLAQRLVSDGTGLDPEVDHRRGALRSNGPDRGRVQE